MGYCNNLNCICGHNPQILEPNTRLYLEVLPTASESEPIFIT